MRLSLVVLSALCAVALSTTTEHQTKHDQNFLERQKLVLQLFYKIQQPSHIPEHVEIAKTYSIADHKDHYAKPEVVENFLQDYKYDPLLQGEIFSVFNKAQLKQAVNLFKLLYYSQTWDTFYKTAVWARQHLNEGMFIYSFSVAIIHRPDTRGIVLPPIYEIYPHYFFSSEVMNQASYYKQIHSQSEADHKHEEYTVDSNYSGWYLNLHPEQSMSYYLEDVGINAFYYYYKLHYPSWMSSEEFGWKNSRRGELFYYINQQILARYYLERISNGFGEVPYLDWEEPIETPYYPSLSYPNGLEFPSRPKFANLHDYFYNYGQKWSSSMYGYSYNLARDYERRMGNAIDSGYIFSNKGELVLTTEEPLNMLGNLIECNHDSLNRDYYGPVWQITRHLLGYSQQAYDHHKLVPSALEHWETSLRDPAFYQIVKRIVLQFQRYFHGVPSYTEKDLVLPGVKVTDVEFDSLVTYKDHFYSELNNGVWYNPSEEHFLHIRVRQQRLNHKPFTYKVHVKSDKEQKVNVKIYIGPKYDEYGRILNLTENRLNMVELDNIEYDLKVGDNVITRNTHESSHYAPDHVSYTKLYKQVVDTLEGNGEYKVHATQNFFAFPQRYMLPKGSSEGSTYQFVVIVYPHVVQPEKMHKTGSVDLYQITHSLGYPFDRFIQFEKMWYEIPNIYFHDEKIYFKDIYEIDSHHH